MASPISIWQPPVFQPCGFFGAVLVLTLAISISELVANFAFSVEVPRINGEH
jgi:hypothetical protein